MTTLYSDNGMLVLQTPYNPALVTAIKGLPYTERRWDNGRKVWLIDPKHGKTLTAWLNVYTGMTVTLPQVVQAKTCTEILDVRYVGTCKPREDGSSVAFGWMRGAWSVVFPESVLRYWFDGTVYEANAETLYSLLGVRKEATADEIKSAFRRMARQWHPDVCREPNAAEMFMRVQEASSVLSDTQKRARYDAGLKFAATTKTDLPQNTYRAPLRCGYIMVEALIKVGRYEVTKILAWEDITRGGKTLIVSWPRGAEEPVEVWA